MDLRGQEIKNTYGNVVTIGSSAGSPTTGELTNGQNSSFTSTYLGGNFGIGSAPTTYGSLNVLALGSAGSAAGGIIDIVGTSGRLASIYTEASGKLVLTADPTNGEAGTSMEFNVDGSNAMFIDSSRNVGIGLVLPTELLHVAGNLKLSDGADRSIKGPANANLIISNNASSSSQGIKFSTDGGTTTDVFIQDGGNVGIGTSSPSYKLEVNSASDTDVIAVTTSNSNSAILSTYNSNASSGNFMQLRSYGAGTSGTVFGNSIAKANMLWSNSDNLFAIGTIGATPLIFGTQNAERMRIDSSGNVGIGTTSPSSVLHIKNSAPEIVLEDSDAANRKGKVLANNGNLGLFADSDNVQSDSIIYFNIDSSEKMRIDSSGNVGIGTSSPTAKLHVQGTSYFFDQSIFSDKVGIGTTGPSVRLHVVGSSSDTAGTGLLRIEGGGGGGNVSWTFRSTVTNNDLTLDRQYGGAYYQALTFQRSSGNVGIGTTTPETKLDVDGDIQTAAPETSTNAAWKLGNVGLGGVEVGPIDYITVSVGGFVVKLPIAIFPETQAFYDRVIADGGTFEGLLGYESAVTILKAQ